MKVTSGAYWMNSENVTSLPHLEKMGLPERIDTILK